MLHITLLGIPHIVTGDSERSITAPLLAELLGYLALMAPEGRALPREVITETLYPHLPPASARRVLNDTLYRLRSTLGSASGCVRSDAYMVHFDKATVDVTTFRRLALAGSLEDQQAAIELYHGDLLEPLDADWLLGQRALLQDLYLATLTGICTQLIRAERPTDALVYAYRWEQGDPFNEAAHRTVMQIYAQLGRHQAALDHFAQLAAMLDTELQAIPMAETRELARNIASHYRHEADQGNRWKQLQPQLDDQERLLMELVVLLGPACTLNVLGTVLGAFLNAAYTRLTGMGLLHLDAAGVQIADPQLGAQIRDTIPAERMHHLLRRVAMALHRSVHQGAGTRQIQLARRTAPLGRAIKTTDQVLVQWSVEVPDIDRTIFDREGKVALRRHRILRLMQEAADQEASPTDADLASVLKVSLRTIEADIQALQHLGFVVQTRRRRDRA